MSRNREDLRFRNDRLILMTIEADDPITGLDDLDGVTNCKHFAITFISCLERIVIAGFGHILFQPLGKFGTDTDGTG